MGNDKRNFITIWIISFIQRIQHRIATSWLNSLFPEYATDYWGDRIIELANESYVTKKAYIKVYRMVIMNGTADRSWILHELSNAIVGKGKSELNKDLSKNQPNEFNQQANKIANEVGSV